MALSREDKEDLVGAITEVLNRRRSIDEAQHRVHHKWVESKMQKEAEKEQRSKELRAKLEESVLGWLIIVFLAGIGVMAYQAAIGALKKAINGGG